MIKFFSGSFKETHTPGNSEKTRLVGWDLMRSILWALALLGKDLMEFIGLHLTFKLIIMSVCINDNKSHFLNILICQKDTKNSP